MGQPQTPQPQPSGEEERRPGEVIPGRDGQEGTSPGVQSCQRSEGSVGHRQLERALHGGLLGRPRPTLVGQPPPHPPLYCQAGLPSPGQQVSLLATLTRAGVAVAAWGAGGAQQ